MGVSAEQRETVGQRIRRLRKERGFSQIVLAEQVGVTDAWISQVETDKSTPSAELLHNIASILKIPIRDLLQDEEAHLELHTRIKLVEVLLESNQPVEAEKVLLGLQQLHLSDSDGMKLTVHQAECKYQQKQYDAALQLLIPLVQRLEAVNYHDAHMLAWIHNGIGRVCVQKRDFSSALYRFMKAYDLINRFVHFDALAAKVAYNVGITLRKVGRARDSIFYLNQANQYAVTHNDIKVMAYTLLGQGTSYKNLKDLKRASECFEQAKTLFQSLKLTSFFNEIQLLVASSITSEQNPQLALEQLDQCMTSFQQSEDYSGMVHTLCKMARIHLTVDNRSEALSCLDRSEEMIRCQGLSGIPEIGEHYDTFARYHFYCKQYVESINDSVRAAELFGELGLIRDEVNSLQIAADVCREMGDMGTAWQYERRCVELLKALQEGGTLI